MLWSYLVRENQQPIDNNSAPPSPAYMIFTNGHIRFQGDLQYDLNYFDYANFV